MRAVIGRAGWVEEGAAMTRAQAAWLRKLRDEGPHVAYGIGKTGYFCRINGWAAWAGDAHESGDYRESITPAGLAALAAHEGEKK